MSEFFQQAKALVINGFSIFPVKYKDKIPLTKNGFKDASISFEQLETWDKQFKEYNIGIRTGNGLAVIDIDVNNGGTQSWIELTQNDVVPDTICAQTGGGGRHYFFKGDIKNTVSKLGKGIDTRGDKGYVVCPPSLHASGKYYEWLPGHSPDEIELADLPDFLNPHKVKGLKTDFIKNDFITQENLKEEVPSLINPVSEGSRNDSLARYAGKFIQKDLPLKDVLEICHLWNRQNSPPLSDSEVKRTVESIFNTDKNNNPEKDFPGLDPLPEKLIQSDILKPNLTLEQLKVGGIIQEMCEWMDKCAYRKQPILSFANSIAFFASVIGRNYKLEDDTRSNLYILGISRTGSGKDNSRKRVASLASEAKLGYLMGGEDITSGAAILTALDKTSRKTVFFPFDEMGAFLSSKTGRNSSSHQAEIPALLTKLYTSSNSIHFGKQYADEKSRPRAEINQPHVTLYGTSNPVDLFKSVTEDMISSGFFGRMLCFFPKSDRPKANKDSKAYDVPFSLISDLNKWADFVIPPPWDKGNLEGIVNHYPNIIKISDEAKDVFFNYDELFFKYGQVYKFTKNLDALWVRGVEQAKKLALVFTCSLARVPGDMPPISAQMAEDCCQMIKILIERICIECDQNVIGSDFEALQKKIMDAIRLSGDIGATASKIFLATRAWKPMERNNALQVLIEAGLIMLEKTKIDNSRKSTNFYFLRRHNIVNM